MTGFDASSSELYSGPVEILVELAEGTDSDPVEFVENRILTFLKALKAGFFFPGNFRGPATEMVRVSSMSFYCQLEVVDLATTAFDVLGGMLADCRHHEISFRSAHAILGNDRKDLLVETALRPDAVHSPPFSVDFPTDLSGNYALLVEIEFANPVAPDLKQRLLDELALWDDLSFAYPEHSGVQAPVSGGQGHFNDPRTIHHCEWVWEAEPIAWNLLVNLCCAWNRTLPIVRLHIE